MTNTVGYDPQRLSDAVAAEVRAELGRRNMSTRDLATATDANHTYWNGRLTNRNRSTGVLTPLNVRDLAGIALAFDMHPSEIVIRAAAALSAAEPANVIDIRDRNSSDGASNLEHLKGLPSAAAPKRRDTGQGEDNA